MCVCRGGGGGGGVERERAVITNDWYWHQTWKIDFTLIYNNDIALQINIFSYLVVNEMMYIVVSVTLPSSLKFPMATISFNMPRGREMSTRLICTRGLEMSTRLIYTRIRSLVNFTFVVMATNLMSFHTRTSHMVTVCIMSMMLFSTKIITVASMLKITFTPTQMSRAFSKVMLSPILNLTKVMVTSTFTAISLTVTMAVAR